MLSFGGVGLRASWLGGGISNGLVLHVGRRVRVFSCDGMPNASASVEVQAATRQASGWGHMPNGGMMMMIVMHQ